ncbi:BrnA antitoxin family protein [Thalassotalea sp. G20_0]|uniref:BrnA antitoxin family protein n=1 Tax=Thalassotalea sp. G20_0 TaxID=2821093 RepID=UPI001ADD22D1|nr:BrnA antitoxin family protein [Thalassotalea sp. G20_0]MBO9497232.1 BrnA antitoxin family protein [Thalassotalea sp. G20_0]
MSKIPEFKSEAEERAFWEKHDSTRYLDWSQAESVSMPNLKPSTKTISLRLPEGLLESIKIEANKRDMPYQSLIKYWLAGHVDY